MATHVITRKRLNDFAALHPDCESALAKWYRLIRGGSFASFVELRKTFSSADRQLRAFAATGHLHQVVDHIAEETIAGVPALAL